MNFSEQPPSSDWTPLNRQDERIAETWFKPEDDSSALLFRVPRERFDVVDLTQLLTIGDLLTAAGIPTEAVESWQFGDESHAGLDGTNPEFARLLPTPDAAHLTIRVRLKPPARDEGSGREVTSEEWQILEARWKSILGVEAGIETLRLSLEGLRAEMEGEARRALSVEDKVHALQADVALWNKAKSRVHYALPKVREFIHRATWALGVPERKRLEELVKNHVEPRVPYPRMDEIRDQLEHLLKDRQVLLAQGNAVSQECRGVTAEIQRTLGTLQRNAADRARKERSAKRQKGKYF